MQGRAGAGPVGLRSQPRALPPVLPPPPQFASEEEMASNQIAQMSYHEVSNTFVDIIDFVCVRKNTAVRGCTDRVHASPVASHLLDEGCDFYCKIVLVLTADGPSAYPSPDRSRASPRRPSRHFHVLTLAFAIIIPSPTFDGSLAATRRERSLFLTFFVARTFSVCTTYVLLYVLNECRHNRANGMYTPAVRTTVASSLYPRCNVNGKVIALICGLLVIILMVLGLASADWLMAAGWRQGLFMHCIDPEAPTPLPFDITAQPGCYAARPAPYIKAAAGLCVATLAADVCGALLTGLGLRATDHRTKFRYYRFAVLAMSLALMCILIALVIYPVCFAAELNLGNRSVWEFGWAYGVGWGAAIFLFGAVVLLLCDKESEELYYKERKVVSGEAGARP
ncbi:unnamed protein product [Leptosia nina]|uniref:Transmembrane protein 47 n=1 Tax=Leptosia nina TaxID=320188 RepID=A0AAV1K5X5_9NEOP